MGRDHTDASVRSEMRTEALGEAAGRAIHLSGHKEPDKLWAAYRGLTGAEAAYARVSLGMSLHAKTAKIEMMPERMETRADDKPDLRSEDERHRDAVNTWMRWQGYMGHLLSSEQSAIWAIVRDRADPVAKTANGGAVLTRAGRDFVDAMASLSEVLERSSGTR